MTIIHMLSVFNSNSPALLKKKAKVTFEDITKLTSDARSARSARARAAMLARAFIDKTFIEGAERMGAYQDVAMLCLAQGKPIPPEPAASGFQEVETATGAAVWVYLPEEYAEAAFSFGARYQRMDITAEQAVDGAQNLLDQVCRYEFKYDEPLTALTFLREELEMEDETASGDPDDDVAGEDES